MDATERLAIESACTRLVHEYAYLVDFREYDRFADLFVEDCLFDVAGQSVSSREEMRAAVQRRPANRIWRHVTTNVLINVVDEDSATGVGYFTVYRAWVDEGTHAIPTLRPAVVGHYRDKYVRVAGGWKFAERIGVFDMMDRELNF